MPWRMSTTPQLAPDPVRIHPRALSRAALAATTGHPVTRPPVRIVHLGLGAFHRAHQAWYTDQADRGREWGIAAFTGRSPQAADEVANQDGLFHVLERSVRGDRAVLVESVVEAWDGSRLDRLVPLLAAEGTAIVTLTITEAGYRLTRDGLPDPDDPAMTDDLTWLSRAGVEPALPWADGAESAGAADRAGGGPATALGRLVLGLEARRRAGAGPLAVVPCDNMPSNGDLVRTGVLAIAQHVNPATAPWIAANISFVSTSVDRITPATTPADAALVTHLTGWADAAPVVCEPFADWVLSGAFPAGRPRWEDAGVTFVEDINPFERRKLWLLNGAHSLLAYAGLLRGRTTVAEAVADPVCRGWVESLWDEAGRALPPASLDLDGYRAALLTRFENARIEHRLSQIAAEGVAKLRVRVVDVALHERASGRGGEGCARLLGAWIAVILAGERDGHDAVTRPPDSAASEIDRALDASQSADGARAVVDRLLALVDPRLAADRELSARVCSVVAAFG